MNPIFSFLLLALFSTNSLFSFFFSGKNEPKALKIQTLLPNPDWMIPLAIDPAIPERFVSRQGPRGKEHLYFWGEDRTIKEYINSNKIIGPLFIVTLSLDNEYDHEKQSFAEAYNQREELEKIGIMTTSFRTFSWGSHPIQVFEGTARDKQIHMAWIANLANSAVLFVNYLYPEHWTEEEGKKIWVDFLSNTHELTGFDFYRALGHEMYEGHTIFAQNHIRLKASVEARHATQELLYVVEPISPNTTFEVTNITFGALGGDWNTGKPLAKIYGTASYSSKNMHIVGDVVISVMIQDVDTFSFNIQKLKKKKNIAYELMKF